MKQLDAFGDPGVAAIVDGEIVLLGPDNIAFSLTPEAALETGRNLIEAASLALERRRALQH